MKNLKSIILILSILTITCCSKDKQQTIDDSCFSKSPKDVIVVLCFTKEKYFYADITDMDCKTILLRTNSYPLKLLVNDEKNIDGSSKLDLVRKHLSVLPDDSEELRELAFNFLHAFLLRNKISKILTEKMSPDCDEHLEEILNPNKHSIDYIKSKIFFKKDLDFKSFLKEFRSILPEEKRRL